MIIEEEPGFHVERTEAGPTLVVTASWSKQAEQVIESGGADGLDLNYAKGFKDTDLAFVRAWPLKRLTLLARTVKDIAPIYSLSSTLESLRVQSAPAATIDLGKFPLLKRVSAEWIQVRSSIGECPGLTDLFLRAYSEIDLGPLRWNSQLVRLRFKDRPRLLSLAGLEALQSIEHLGVYLAPLRDITALSALAPNQLRELHLESCRIRDLSPAADSHGLRLLNASDCGDMESVHPLGRLSHLEVLWLFGTTRVLDEDLSPIAELPELRELRMRSRKTYRPSVEDVQALIARRVGA